MSSYARQYYVLGVETHEHVADKLADTRWSGKR